jgi:serine/threonine protein kinase
MGSSERIWQLIAETKKYRLESENQEGANAYTFRAHHLNLDLPVFLKVIDADTSQDLFSEPRLLVEATKVREGDSNLVRVYDAELLGNDYVLIAMELVPEGSVLSRLKTSPMPLMDAVNAAIGILHGLAQLHQALLVHRDIKPANILLSSRHGRVWPKITDFGSVARIAHRLATVTASRHSALYVPPEGWASPSQYSTLSDQYQLGIVLYEMANGSLPYTGEAYFDRIARRELNALKTTMNEAIHEADRQFIANQAIARAACGKGVIEFGKNKSYMPKSLSRIIKRATASDASRRYNSLSEMIGELEALQFPNWSPSSCGNKLIANHWRDLDWEVEKCSKNPLEWTVRRSRAGANSFRLWCKSHCPMDACKKVNELIK